MRRRWILPAVLAAVVLPLWAGTAGAQRQPIAVDLSNHLVAISTGFSGTSLLLFGATDGPGNIVLVVRGPNSDLRVRRKGQIGGIWLNRDSMLFTDVPSFYMVAASRPLTELVSDDLLARNQIGLGNLSLEPADSGADPALVEVFRDALIRLKESQGLYGSGTGEVRLQPNRLFRADIRFPANVPTGRYLVTVFLVRDGKIAGAETTPVQVSKIGIGARISAFAHEQAWAYGVAAAVISALLGWVASAAFRRS